MIHYELIHDEGRLGYIILKSYWNPLIAKQSYTLWNVFIENKVFIYCLSLFLIHFGLADCYRGLLQFRHYTTSLWAHKAWDACGWAGIWCKRVYIANYNRLVALFACYYSWAQSQSFKIALKVIDARITWFDF